MIKILITVFLFTIVSCNSKSVQKTGNTLKTDLAIADSLYAVIKYYVEGSYPFKRGEPTELTIQEIKEIEEILERAVEANNQIQKENLKKQDSLHPKETGFELKTEGHYRQYVAVINEKGEKLVWINLSCREFSNKKWQTELLPPVTDGGNCHYNLKINLTHKTYSELRINSHA